MSETVLMFGSLILWAALLAVTAVRIQQEGRK